MRSRLGWRIAGMLACGLAAFFGVRFLEHPIGFALVMAGGSMLQYAQGGGK